MPAIFTHSHGVCIGALSKPYGSSSLNPSPLNLPSRFPSSSQPRITASPGSSFYLWSENSPIIWEYDTRGKRIGEMIISADTARQVGVVKILALGMIEGKETLCAAVSSTSGTTQENQCIRIMEKDGGKWRCAKTLESLQGQIISLDKNRESNLIISTSIDGEVLQYDLVKGTQRILSDDIKCDGAQTNMVFAPSMPNTIIYPSESTLCLVDLDSMTRREIRPFTTSSQGNITSIIFSPVIDGADGRKGGLCAVLKENSGEVALVGLDDLRSTSKILDYVVELRDIHFLDGATLCGITESGSLLIKDLRSLAKEPVEISLNHPILSIKTLSAQAKSSRPSIAPSEIPATSRRLSILGEARHAGNIERPPSSQSSGATSKHKAYDSTQHPAKDSKTSRTEEKRTRIVSAPPTSSMEREQTKTRHPNPSRSASSSALLPPRPSVGPSHRPIPVAPVIEEEEEEEEEEELESDRAKPDDLNLSWALRPSAQQAVEAGDQREEVSWEAMEAMRRQIGDLQLELLRMGRTLRHEIRLAVAPLKKELEVRGETVERQRKEIERLRRGY